VKHPTPTPLTCEQAARRLWAYVDGRLSPLSRTELEEHLATCAGCPRFFAFATLIRDTLAALGPASEGRADSGAEAALRIRVRSALAQSRAAGIE